MNSSPKLVCLALMFALFSSPAAAVLPMVDANGKPYPSLAPMLKKVNPAVVNISTFSTQEVVQNPLLNDPFFRRFFNLPEPAKRGLGCHRRCRWRHRHDQSPRRPRRR